MSLSSTADVPPTFCAPSDKNPDRSSKSPRHVPASPGNMLKLVDFRGRGAEQDWLREAARPTEASTSRHLTESAKSVEFSESTNAFVDEKNEIFFSKNTEVNHALMHYKSGKSEYIPANKKVPPGMRIRDSSKSPTPLAAGSKGPVQQQKNAEPRGKSKKISTTVSAFRQLFCTETIPPFVDPAMMCHLMVRESPPPLPSPPTKKRKLAPTLREKSVMKYANLSEHLTYDWSVLGLGTRTGSAAWNNALREELLRNPSLKKVPQVSPVDCLEDAQRIQRSLETVMPPEGSDLDKRLLENGLLAAREIFEDDPPETAMQKAMEKVYQTMILQDFDDGETSSRRYQFMKAKEVPSHLMEIENEIARLALWEQRLRGQLCELGFSTFAAPAEAFIQ